MNYEVCYFRVCSVKRECGFMQQKQTDVNIMLAMNTEAHGYCEVA